MMVTSAAIDALLPQTQCGLCGYPGCMPYAKALAAKEAAINLCPPGGVSTLDKLATLLQEDAAPYREEMRAKAKPKQIVRIREAECIGCTKCIQACPVDAILGSAKNMHSIIERECTGCELCIAPCPVDCIDIVIRAVETDTAELERANLARLRFQARETRLHNKPEPPTIHPTQDKKHFIQAALERAKLKKQT